MALQAVGGQDRTGFGIVGRGGGRIRVEKGSDANADERDSE
jgi:hypothetical protein